MFNYKIFQKPVIQASCPAHVNDWITRQQNSTSLSETISIENDHLIIRTDIDNSILLNLDWSSQKITVTEARNLGFRYEFREFRSAFSFLDALLLHHFIKTPKPRVERASLGQLGALAG